MTKNISVKVSDPLIALMMLSVFPLFGFALLFGAIAFVLLLVGAFGDPMTDGVAVFALLAVFSFGSAITLACLSAKRAAHLVSKGLGRDA